MRLSPSSVSRFTIAITVRQADLPRWVRDIVSGLREDGHTVRVIMPLVMDRGASLLWDPPSRFLSFAWEYRLYRVLERRAGPPSVDLDALDAAAERAEIALPGARIPCDILIDLAVGGDIRTEASRLGVLRVELGTGRSVNERLFDLASSETALRSRACLTRKDGSRAVLGEAWAPAHPFSLDRSLYRCRARIAPMVRKAVNGLASAGNTADRPLAECPPDAPLVLAADVRRYFRPVATKLLLRALGSAATRFAEKLLYRHQWALVLAREDSRMRQQVIVPPADRFWADPFPYFRNGSLWLFFEEQLFGAPHARLACAKVDDEGGIEAPRPILELPYHLSYPYLVERDGELFMIPESHQNKTIDLYRCVDFPTGWEKFATLIEGLECADTSVVHRPDGWWLFTSSRSAGSSLNEELYVFHADDLLSGEWTPHHSNPILSDVRSSRCAGRIYEMDGRLFRPSQDCAGGYGKAVVINEIVELDEWHYREVPRVSIPASAIRGLVTLHTYNAHGGAVVVDGQLRRARLWVDGAKRLGKLGMTLMPGTRLSRGADISLLRVLAAGYYD